MRDRLAEQGSRAPMVWRWWWRTCSTCHWSVRASTSSPRKAPCGDPWNPNPTIVDNVMQMLEGIHKVLKPDGIFISINFGQVMEPHFRCRFFEAPGFTWSADWSTFGDGFHYFFYTLKKGKRSPECSGYQTTLPAAPIMNMFHEELESEDYIFRTRFY